MDDRVIITAALTGVLATRDHCPAIPFTPAEIAAEAVRARDAGAAAVHIHAREDDGSPSFRAERYAEIASAVRAAAPELLLNFSTGAVGVSRDVRIAHVPATRPELAALNMGSMNYAIYSRQRQDFVVDLVFANSFGDIGYFLRTMVAAGVKPELECFDRGHIANAEPFRAAGLLREPVWYSLILGVLGGIPAGVDELAGQVRALPAGALWQVIGISLDQWRLAAAALAMGGHVRVGLEDNFYLAPGAIASSNGDLVEKAARLAREVGRTPATPAEARHLLGLA